MGDRTLFRSGPDLSPSTLVEVGIPAPLRLPLLHHLPGVLLDRWGKSKVRFWMWLAAVIAAHAQGTARYYERRREAYKEFREEWG